MGKKLKLIGIGVLITVLLSALGWATYTLFDEFFNSIINIFPVNRILALIIFIVIIAVILVLLGYSQKKLIKKALGM